MTIYIVQCTTDFIEEKNPYILIYSMYFITQEKYEDTKGVIRSQTSKNIQYNSQTKKGHLINKTLHRKLKIEQHELN